MPHMANLPWLEIYLLITMLLMSTFSLLFFNSKIQPLNTKMKKKINKFFYPHNWKW